MTSDPAIRNVSDTAIWAALFRARETERPNPLFRDPYAKMLAGTRGDQIAAELRDQEKHSWAWVIRTYIFDSFIRERIEAGADFVINLAAGLDARPYRMDLPASLRWLEVDLPDLIAYKEKLLATERPKCRLERISMDLADRHARRDLFRTLGSESMKALIITEGLLIYFTPDDALRMAEDLAGQATFRDWVLDIASPGLLKMLQREVGASLDRARAPLQFAPLEGPSYFEPAGWRVAEIRSTLKSAAKVMKLPLMIRFFSLFPERQRPGNQPWSATCRLEH
jgi:methyltransferase (TIGR00027 family)